MAEPKTAPAHTGEESPEQKIIALAADALNNAKELYLEFNEHKYRGDILDWRLGEYILFRVRHADDGLVRVPVNYENCRLRVVLPNNKSHSFPVRLMQKKIPHLLVSFPVAMDAEHVRTAPRHFMKQSTPLLLKRKENVLVTSDRTGLGILLNVSKGGVMLQSALALEKGDRVHIFVDIIAAGAKKKLEMPSIVRRAERQGKMFVYGLEFYKAPENALRELARFLGED